jgi:hypothetical protein
MIFGRGSENDNKSIQLATRKGQRIPNERAPERLREAYLEADRIHRHSFSRIKLNSLGGAYNCVGLVFASRRTWIEPMYVSMILKDDGYFKITEAESRMGDVIIYKDKDDLGEVVHVGLIHSWENWGTTNVQLWILSQWGQDNEYVHLVSDLPEAIRMIVSKIPEYWTHRII